MLPTSCGVPHGSALWQLHFTICTTRLYMYNELCYQNRNLDHLPYADDTQIYITLATSDTCRSLNQLTDCFQDVSLWVKNIKLKFNVDNSKFIIIGIPPLRRKLDGFSPTQFFS